MKMTNKPQKTEFGYDFGINKNVQKEWVKCLEDDGVNAFLSGLENKYLQADDGMFLKTADGETFTSENLNLTLEVWEDDLDTANRMVKNMIVIIDRTVKGL